MHHQNPALAPIMLARSQHHLAPLQQRPAVQHARQPLQRSGIMVQLVGNPLLILALVARQKAGVKLIDQLPARQEAPRQPAHEDGHRVRPCRGVQRDERRQRNGPAHLGDELAGVGGGVEEGLGAAHAVAH